MVTIIIKAHVDDDDDDDDNDDEDDEDETNLSRQTGRGLWALALVILESLWVPLGLAYIVFYHGIFWIKPKFWYV